MKEKTGVSQARQSLIPVTATAIILAGGGSRRMRREKCLLPVGGEPLIQYIARQLRTCFTRILISSNNPHMFTFLGLPVIPDQQPGCGPLMGIASAMQQSQSSINFITACDIPEINLDFVRCMIREAAGVDGVVPVTRRDYFEPLFAVYKKSILPGMFAFLRSGGRKIDLLYTKYKIKFIQLEDNSWLKNLNTRQEYDRYLQNNKKNN